MEQKQKMSMMRLSSMFLCFIFLFMNYVGLVTPFQFTNATDRQALLAIKDRIPGDPLHVLSSWNHSVHFCKWQGVTCGRLHQRVTMLNLSSLQLVGSVSPHVGNLTFLRTMVLSGNSFQGTIPPEIGRLFRLQFLELRNNSFGGEFPANLTQCSNLKYIFLTNNNLVGKIPIKLGSMLNLVTLTLQNNYFSGTIPPSLGNLSSLVRLSLESNNLVGSIPSELGHLSKLEFISLGYNNLTGLVPTSLFNISSITTFSLSGNQLHGTLPQDLGLTLPNLNVFYPAINQFSGPIPISLANASGLVLLDINRNAFTGPIPMNLGTLKDLEVFSASDNLLGTNGRGNDLNDFLTSVTNCSNLRTLTIASNRFQGSLPHSIVNLSTMMTLLWLDNNNISGTIPPGIGNLVSVSSLGLSQNMLVGSIPDSIGQLSNLGQLYLYMNSISGKIPSSIGNIGMLNVLSLSYNRLDGSIPISLGMCVNLQAIDLTNNSLTGSIPDQVVGLSSISIYFSVANNNLTGQLPSQVGNLKNLGKLIVSDNKLSGQIPSALGSCQLLESLYMQGNLFEGTIPASFVQLQGIQVLDLSRNNLSGQIPSFLGEFTSIQYLNLSYNMLEGEVPNEGVFTNMSAFSVVGNDKLCGGIKELQLPACPAKRVGKMKKPISWRVIIPLVTTSVIVLLLLCILGIAYRIRRSRQEAASLSPLQSQLPKVSYAELLQATNGFSSTNLIGEGSYGSVYKGILSPSDQIVAVKVLKLERSGANKSFMAECEALRTIRHRNLVKIITSCSSIDFKGEDFKALVFEFMENGSLERWLHPSLNELQEFECLNLGQRLNTAIDVATALDYLHNQCETAIVHCDLKPSNVLLDGDLGAHVGDFGLARILSTVANHQQSSSVRIRGTIGYVAPEYGMGGEISTQGDMYSYGVLLLEMFTGKRPTNTIFIDGFSLHSYAKRYLPDRVMEILDPRIILVREEESSNASTTYGDCLVSIIQIGVSCSVQQPSERMDAKDVLTELRTIRDVFLGVRRKVQSDRGRNNS